MTSSYIFRATPYQSADEEIRRSTGALWGQNFDTSEDRLAEVSSELDKPHLCWITRGEALVTCGIVGIRPNFRGVPVIWFGTAAISPEFRWKGIEQHFDEMRVMHLSALLGLDTIVFDFAGNSALSPQVWGLHEHLQKNGWTEQPALYVEGREIILAPTYARVKIERIRVIPPGSVIFLREWRVRKAEAWVETYFGIKKRFVESFSNEGMFFAANELDEQTFETLVLQLEAAFTEGVLGRPQEDLSILTAYTR